MKLLPITLLIIGSSGCGVNPCDAPSGWDIDHIRDRLVSTEGHGFTDLRMPEFESPTVTLLARQAKSAVRGTDTCLAVLEGRTMAGRDAWVLATLRRWPTEAPPWNDWRIPWLAHRELHGSVHLDRAPTNEDLVAFLAQIPTSGEWFDPDCVEVDAAAWKTITGADVPAGALGT